MIVITPATRHVDVTAPARGSPSPPRPRIAGFKKMMYDITMKVVRPAIVSRASVVPFSANLKWPSSAERRKVAASSVIPCPFPSK